MNTGKTPRKNKGRQLLLLVGVLPFFVVVALVVASPSSAAATAAYFFFINGFLWPCSCSHFRFCAEVAKSLRDDDDDNDVNGDDNDNGDPTDDGRIDNNSCRGVIIISLQWNDGEISAKNS